MASPVYDLIVIGGGAAGFFGAIACAEARPQSRLLILERGNQPLGKVLLTGGGRCNLTHAAFDPAVLVQNYPRGGQALRGAFTRFGPQDTMRWFESHGVPLKIEADGRVFPASNSSTSVIHALLEAARAGGAEVKTRAPVTALHWDSDRGLFDMSLPDASLYAARKVLLATGGDPQAYDLPAGLGHTIRPPVPSLFTFTIPDARLEGLAGVSVPEVELRLPGANLQARGPLLITHWGLSGPAVLRLSAWGARPLADAGYRMDLQVNWLPGYHMDSLYQRLLQARGETPRQQVATRDPAGRLPLRLWKRLVQEAGIPGMQTWGDSSNAALHRLAEALTRAVFHIRGKGVYKEEFVTCGGAALDEVDFKTMQSRRLPGLHLAGEVLDIDGLTGGFNLQSAWTTGFLAGRAAAESLRGAA